MRPNKVQLNTQRHVSYELLYTHIMVKLIKCAVNVEKIEMRSAILISFVLL